MYTVSAFYAGLKNKPGGPFKRLTGVRPATFLDMCEALEEHLPSGGRAPNLCLQDRLLLSSHAKETWY